MSQFAQGMRGVVRVFGNSSSINCFLHNDLSSFLIDNEGVNIELEEHNSSEIFMAVSEGFADVGIMANDIEAGSLDVFPYAQDHLVLVVSPEHPLAKRDVISLEESLNFDFVCMPRSEL